jgi:hypothetical protein
MITQNYLLIENNVITNVCLWDGNTETWTPPSDATMLIQSTTPVIVWKPIIIDNKITDYVLAESIGVGNIGFTWDGTVCTTNEPKPAIPTTR